MVRVSPMQTSPGGDIQASTEPKEEEHIRCRENSMCKGPKVGGGTCRRNQEETSVAIWYEGNERGLRGDAEGAVGAKWGSCRAHTVWERITFAISCSWRGTVVGPHLWAPQACPVSMLILTETGPLESCTSKAGALLLVVQPNLEGGAWRAYLPSPF